MSAASRTPTPMLSVYDGRECRGFVLNRGKAGYKAVDHNEQSLGCFPHQQDAIIAILNGGSP